MDIIWGEVNSNQIEYHLRFLRQVIFEVTGESALN